MKTIRILNIPLGNGGEENTIHIEKNKESRRIENMTIKKRTKRYIELAEKMSVNLSYSLPREIFIRLAINMFKSIRKNRPSELKKIKGILFMDDL